MHFAGQRDTGAVRVKHGYAENRNCLEATPPAFCSLPIHNTRAEAFGETVATWPQHSIYRIWETALERYVARCDRDLGREQAQSIRLFWQCNIQRACTEHPPVNIQVDATVIAEQVFGSLMQLMGAADNDM